MGESIFNWFKSADNVDFLKRLEKAGLKIIYPKKKSNQPLQGKKFVLTGSLSSMTRETATQKIRNLGGQVSGNVSAKTDFLICGASPGAKHKKAKNLGVKILSEEQLLQILEQEKAKPN